MKEPECFICGIDDLHSEFVTEYNENSFNMCVDCQEEIVLEAQMVVHKKCTIEIAHMLEGHLTCGTMHGHSVDIVLGIRGCMDLKTGMVIDFKSLKRITQKEIVDRFDHTCLNDVLPIPTAEYLAFYIFKRIASRGFDVAVVRVHETKNNYVEYRGPTNV